ncbi:hypothetical protein Bbelb_230060 [Branchiostoma belcheri]|nr:hypothetical protein Bbelb_230060 [Branchiostoma belcheri]
MFCVNLEVEKDLERCDLPASYSLRPNAIIQPNTVGRTGIHHLQATSSQFAPTAILKSRGRIANHWTTHATLSHRGSGLSDCETERNMMKQRNPDFGNDTVHHRLIKLCGWVSLSQPLKRETDWIYAEHEHCSSRQATYKMEKCCHSQPSATDAQVSVDSI